MLSNNTWFPNFDFVHNKSLSCRHGALPGSGDFKSLRPQEHATQRSERSRGQLRLLIWRSAPTVNFAASQFPSPGARDTTPLPDAQLSSKAGHTWSGSVRVRSKARSARVWSSSIRSQPNSAEFRGLRAKLGRNQPKLPQLWRWMSGHPRPRRDQIWPIPRLVEFRPTSVGITRNFVESGQTSTDFENFRLPIFLGRCRSELARVGQPSSCSPRSCAARLAD